MKYPALRSLPQRSRILHFGSEGVGVGFCHSPLFPSTGLSSLWHSKKDGVDCWIYTRMNLVKIGHELFVHGCLTHYDCAGFCCRWSGHGGAGIMRKLDWVWVFASTASCFLCSLWSDEHQCIGFAWLSTKSTALIQVMDASVFENRRESFHFRSRLALEVTLWSVSVAIPKSLVCNRLDRCCWNCANLLTMLATSLTM